MLEPVQWIAVIGTVGLVILFGAELRRWRLLGAMVGRRQRYLRTVLVALIQILLVMMFVGPFVTGRNAPLESLLYWTATVLLGLSVVVISMLEWYVVVRQYDRLNREMFHDLKRNNRR